MNALEQWIIPQRLADGSTNPEWVKARVGAATASRASDVLAFSKPKSALHIVSPDGEIIERLGNGKTADAKADKARKRGERVELLVYQDGEEYACRADYRAELVAERLTGYCLNHFVTPEMQWGLDHEDDAREAYEVATGNLLDGAGYIEHPRVPFFGATPDAFLMDPERGRGVWETKCPTTRTHMAWLTAGVVPEEHKPQMIAEMLCSGCSWGHFTSFDPRMPKRLRLFVRSFVPTAEEFDRVAKGYVQFLEEVDALFERVAASEPIAL